LVSYGNFLFKYRDALFTIVPIVLFIAFSPEFPRGSATLDALVDVVGLAVAFAGQALRVAVIGYVYIIRGGKNKQVYAEELVTTGFFAHARNPLYIGNLLVYFGLFIIWNNRWVYLLGGLFFVTAYIAIVAAEEAFLRRKFGAAYDAYCARVNRWIPDFRGLGRSLEGMEFNWRRVVLKEYGSAFYWMAGAVVLLVAERLAHSTFRAHRPFVIAMSMVLVGLIFGWITARRLKKSKRLRE
jgi:protein-S-isoprenylcysteine O-methyltransferase Ste14